MAKYKSKNLAIQDFDQKTEEEKRKKSFHIKSIVNKFLAIEKKMHNPLTGNLDNLTIKELLVLKQVANGINGDLKSVQWLMSIIGEEPKKETIEITQNISIGADDDTVEFID